MAATLTATARKEDPISSTIFIGNLSFQTTEEELRAALAEVDPGVRVRLGKDKATGQARGFAFAEFPSPEAAATAIKRFDGFELKGRRLRCNDANDKPAPRAPRPGGGAPPRPGGGAPPPGSFGPRPPREATSMFMDRPMDPMGGKPPGRGGRGRRLRGGKRTLW